MMRRLLLRLRGDARGSAAVEFALIGPALIALMLGIFHVGLGMQNYNALRGASADLARYSVINYQTANRLTNSQLASYGRTLAMRSPYNLGGANLQVTVTNPIAQRVAGATEKTITMQYTVPSLLSMIGVEDVTLRYTRPVFLLT